MYSSAEPRSADIFAVWGFAWHVSRLGNGSKRSVAVSGGWWERSGLTSGVIWTIDTSPCRLLGLIQPLPDRASSWWEVGREKRVVTRVFIHAKRTSAQQYSAGRDNRLVGSFPGLFPKPPRFHVAGCFVRQPAYSTRPLLGFLCGSVRCHGKKPVGIKGPAAQPDLPERF